jgi:hypothetical protein
MESKIIHKIDRCTDIAYSVSASGGGGLVKSRDFVNLRCYQTFCDGRILKDNEQISINLDLADENDESQKSPSEKRQDAALLKKAASEVTLNSTEQQNTSQLSKSLDPKLATFKIMNERNETGQASTSSAPNPKKVFVSAAVSVDYPSAPSCDRYIRGQNILSCWAMRETDSGSEDCIFEWLLCLDLKGSIPKYVLNTVSF